MISLSQIPSALPRDGHRHRAAAAREDGRGVVKVTTVIDNPEHALKAELTGTAKIRGDERPPFDLMTRRLARYVSVEFWS